MPAFADCGRDPSFACAQGSWVRQAARDAGVPIFVVKSAAPSNLTRALRTLLGFDPSAGGTFAGWRERVSRDSKAAPGASDADDPRSASFASADSSNVSPRVSVCFHSRTADAERRALALMASAGLALRVCVVRHIRISTATT